MQKTYISLILVLFFCFFAGFALLHPGLPPTHDGEYHVVRFYEFDKTLRSGQRYPRWAPDLNFGYGIPLFNYVYPLPNYVASLLHFFGSSFIDAVKLNMFFALCTGGIFFYLWTRSFWGHLGGVVSAIFYTFAPYHFVDSIIRGSIGEMWALAWYPAFLWAVTQLVFSKKHIYIPLAGIFLSLIIFSHNILALAFFPFALLYSLVLLSNQENKIHIILQVAIVFLLGVGLSMIFWFPALLETKYVTGLQVFNLNSNFPELYQLLIPSWGSDFFGTGSGNEMSVQIGVINIIIVFVSIFLVIFARKKTKKHGRIFLFFLVSFFVIFFLMVKISLPIWKYVPLMHYFQFPWRFLSLEILVCAFLAGGVVAFFPSIIFASGLIVMLLLTTVGYTKPAYYLYRQDSYYLTRPNFIDGTNSPGNVFTTIWLSGIQKREISKVIIKQGSGEIKSETIASTKYKFRLWLQSNSQIIINTTFFPGWRAYINGKETHIEKTKNGTMIISVPKGNHTLSVLLMETEAQRVGTTGSIISFLLLFTILIKNWYSYFIKKHAYRI